MSKLDTLVEKLTLFFTRHQSPLSPEEETIHREIISGATNLLQNFEELELLQKVHSLKYAHQLPTSLQNSLADYQHRKRVLEIVQPMMMLVSMNMDYSTTSSTNSTLSPNSRQEEVCSPLPLSSKSSKSRLTNVTCPICQKQFWGKKFWKRYHQHRKDAHPNYSLS